MKALFDGFEEGKKKLGCNKSNCYLNGITIFINYIDENVNVEGAEYIYCRQKKSLLGTTVYEKACYSIGNTPNDLPFLNWYKYPKKQANVLMKFDPTLFGKIDLTVIKFDIKDAILKVIDDNAALKEFNEELTFQVNILIDNEKLVWHIQTENDKGFFVYRFDVKNKKLIYKDYQEEND